MRIVLFVSALILALGANAPAEGTVWDVPGHAPTIAAAIDSASAGDEIQVTEPYTEQAMVTVNKAVTITKSTSAEVTIESGGSNTSALVVNVAGVVIDGLSLEATSSNVVAVVALNAQSEISNCVIRDNGYSAIECAHLALGASLQNCTVEASGSDYCVVLEESDGNEMQVLNCTIGPTGNHDQWAAVIVDGRNTSLSGYHASLQGNVITTAEGSCTDGIAILGDPSYVTIADNTISGASEYGLEVFGHGDQLSITGNLFENVPTGICFWTGEGDASIASNTVVRDACDDEGVAVYVGVGYGPADVAFENNLIENYEYGLDFYTSGRPSDWTFSHNAFWAPCGDITPDFTPTSSEFRDDLEPLFCGEREAPVSKYTQRIDSQVSPGNNPWGELVGRWGVECAYDTLLHDATLLDNESAIVLEDVVVPSGKTLTLEGGARLLFDEDDNSAEGSNTSKNELVVDGSLVVAGTVADTVKFVPSQTTQTEGYWYGVHVRSGGEAVLDYAEVTNAVYGVWVNTNESSAVTHSRFGSNQTYDILAGAASGSSFPLRLAHNTITVGGGTGVYFQSVANGAVVDSNAVNGSGSGTAGVALMEFTYGSDVDLTGNSVSGFSNGAGVLQGTTANLTMIQNSISYCKWGVKVTEGSPVIGTTADSDNFFQSNVSGIYAEGSGATPIVRNNYISSNTYGVQAKTSALPDLGTGTGDRGYNFLDGNTTYCIWNRTTGGTALPAQYNYFGECNQGTPPNCVYGNVDNSNGLCTEPARAGGVRMVETPLPARGFGIAGIVPNPMLSGGDIQLSLAEGRTVARVEIFDVTGRLVRTFGDSEVSQGRSLVHWDGRNDRGVPVNSGIYFVRARSSEGQQGSARILVAR